MKETYLKILGFLIFAALCTWVCYKCSGQPLPPGAKPVLHSPKYAEFQKTLAKASAPLAVPLKYNTNTLYWDSNTYTQSVGFSVEWRPEILSKWTVLALITNQYSYRHTPTNSHGFYRVGAFWP